MPDKKSSPKNKVTATAAARRKRDTADPAERLEIIRAENSTATALKRDLRERKPR
jgi:hypothetical protein